MDLHRDRSGGFPAGAVQAEPAAQCGTPTYLIPVEPVVAVAEFARDTQRGRVVLERRRYRPPCAEPVEGQVQHCGPHLGADPLPLIRLAKPGAGVHLAQHRVVAAADDLVADHDAAAEHREPQRPVRGLPRTPAGPVVLDRAAGAFFRGRVRPGHHERLHVGVMHPGGGQAGQRAEVVGAGPAQFQVRGLQPQISQRPVRRQHGRDCARPARPGHPDYHAGQGRPPDGGDGMSSGVAGNSGEPEQVIPESLADLVERPLYAHLATVRPDGTPQVNPTWFRFDGEYLWLTTTTKRQKNRNWHVQPAVALSIADPDRPYRYLEIRGWVERIVPDPQGAEFVRLAERYGLPQGPPPDAADRIAVAVRPQHTTTQ